MSSPILDAKLHMPHRQPLMGTNSSDMGQAAAERVGRTLSSKWHLDRLVATGGMAAVYAATHRNGKRMAIKVLHPAYANNEVTRERFLREGYAANKVDHAGAVSIVDDDVDDDGSVYLVMELLEGLAVEDRIRQRGGTLSIAEVLVLADQVLEVLIAAHAQGIVHRDLKPANLFWTRSGAVKILDFGLARVRDPKLQSALTGVGVVMGTTGYMPPEQARCAWDLVDGRTDLFALGAVMFRALTGRTIHRGSNFAERLMAAMNNPPPPLATAIPDIPVCVADVVDRAVAFDIKDRWADAAAMQQAVREAAEELGIDLAITPDATEFIVDARPSHDAVPTISCAIEEEAPSAAVSILGAGDVVPMTVHECDIPRASFVPVHDPAPAIEKQRSPGEKIRILLVEDEELNRDMLSRRLIRRGYEVAMAFDGEQAIAMMEKERPALVLMDMSLPVMDGWEATRRIKATPHLASTPIVALTAHAMASDRERALQAGCDDFATKPVDFQQLIARIEAWIAR